MLAATLSSHPHHERAAEYCVFAHEAHCVDENAAPRSVTTTSSRR